MLVGMGMDIDARLARRLVLDELFDLSLYRSLRDVAGSDLRVILEQFVAVESRHLAFWQRFCGLELTTLDLGRRLKLVVIRRLCGVFGDPAIQLVLEAIEVYGVRKYLTLWKAYGSGPLGLAVREVLEDEFKHEDALATGRAGRRIRPERIRNIFLGLNDGLVEILGAVSGFFGAFGNASTVLVAGATVAVAGALSMAAGAYVAASAEAEIQATEDQRRQFLNERTATLSEERAPVSGAVVVGVSYLAGAVIPLLPVLFGTHDALPSVLVAGGMIIIVSMLLAFVAGMNVRRRVLINLVIIAAAVGVTYFIGKAVNVLWGISV